MSLYGIYGKHTVEACPANNRQTAERVVASAERDLTPVLAKYKIHKIVSQYHSAFEHTLLWVVDAEDAHLVQEFVFEIGLASFNELKIVPLITFREGVLPLVKKAHGLGVTAAAI